MRLDDFDRAEKILDRAESINKLAVESTDPTEKNRYLAELEAMHQQMRELHIDALTGSGLVPATRPTFIQRIKEKLRS